MSTEENKAVVRRFVQVWGKGSPDIVDELAAPNFSVYYPFLRETLHGPEAFKHHLMGLHVGLPDVEVVNEQMIAEGDEVAVRWTMRGTHTGELSGIPPTGKQVMVTGITIYHLADGKVVEERGQEDALGLLQQLGVIPAVG
ncbi:MAG TPA: ester cyclase [Ktedonobacteraceae bacterium]|nr:ester cyclase [Ktedonobacteraceae bacterium]